MVLLRGATTFDNFLLALIIATIGAILFSPYMSGTAYNAVSGWLGIRGQRLPWWWIIIPSSLLFIMTWIMISSF